MIEVSHFAIRPRPFSGESTRGFLMRVAAVNGFGSVRQLQSRMREGGGSAFERLCQHLILTERERASLFGILPSSWNGFEPPMGLAPSDFNHVRRRWCPLCLSEHGYLQGRWELKLAGTCARHSIWLHDLCGVCGDSQDWLGVDPLRCYCGAVLADAHPEPAEDCVVELCSALEMGSNSHRSDPLRSLELLPLHRAIRYLGLFSIDSAPPRPGQIGGLHQQKAARALLTGMARLMDDWPRCFHAVLSAMQRRSTAASSIQRAFAPLYRVLYVELADTMFQPFRDAFEAYLHEHWWGLVCRRNARMKPSTRQEHPRLTTAQVKNTSLLSAATVRHLIQAQLLPATLIRFPSGRTSTTVHTEDIAQLKGEADGALCLRDFADQVALPQRRLRQLIAAGVLRPLLRPGPGRGGPSQWLVPRAEADRLTVHSAATGTPLRFFLRFWSLTEAESTSLVVHVMERNATDAGPTHSVVGIGDALLDPQEVRRWLNTVREMATPLLSVDQAAKQLGIKQEVAYALIRSGRLQAMSNESGCRKVHPADVQAFATQYISLAEYARSTGQAPRYALNSVQALPVCGPSVDGSRQYFFNRSELIGVTGPPRQAE